MFFQILGYVLLALAFAFTIRASTTGHPFAAIFGLMFVILVSLLLGESGAICQAGGCA